MQVEFKMSFDAANAADVASELEQIADFVRDGYISGGARGEGGKWELSGLPETGPAIIAKLQDMGFHESNTGGGCLAMWKDIGSAYVMVTDYDADVPTDSDWIVGAYNEDGDQLYTADSCGDSMSGMAYAGKVDLDAALKAAIDAAESADMEQAARRRGDLK